LEALIVAGHQVVAVLSKKNRPVGRGFKLLPSLVKRVALACHVPVYQPATLKSAEALALIQSFSAEVVVVSAYGQLLPIEILQATPRGAINIHASLLPRWRGAAPIQRALQAGDTVTGISIMQMEKGLDTGPVLLERPCPIMDLDTSQTLHDRLADLGARAIIEALEGLKTGQLQPVPQSATGVTYAQKITKAEALLDWTKEAEQLARDIRAFNPAPVSRTFLRDELIKVWQAEMVPEPASAIPGTVLTMNDRGIFVACGKGRLALQILQRAGGKPMTAGEFIKGFPVTLGERMGV
ncbi:MAG: methionyl-tRNA formyltransferase, partial [Ferrovum sp.]|nr:methionyl-tRNA formyltransferase [Ferrovum sp.]